MVLEVLFERRLVTPSTVRFLEVQVQLLLELSRGWSQFYYRETNSDWDLKWMINVLNYKTALKFILRHLWSVVLAISSAAVALPLWPRGTPNLGQVALLIVVVFVGVDLLRPSGSAVANTLQLG